MNEIVKKYLLAGDKFSPEMFLKQLEFTNNTCETFIKNKKRIEKLKKKTGDMKHIYRNELDIARFQHDRAFGDFKNLTKRTASDNVLKDKPKI